MQPLIDAYAHAGVPRYGTAAEALAMFDRWKVESAVVVLAPGVPDLAVFWDFQRLCPGRIRAMGIPFGATAAERNELADIQLALGLSGLRLVPSEILENPDILEKLGQRGLWLYAINPHEKAAVAEFLLDWLQRHPAGRIAAPHFLQVGTLAGCSESPALTRALLTHPRFFAIFSRHGAVGSREPYPHSDLRPWVEETAALTTWQRIFWGSEHPVIHSRNERYDAARDWLARCLPGLPAADLANYLHHNAKRELFAAPVPTITAAPVPAWVEQQFDRNRKIPLFPSNAIDLPVVAYQELLSDYLRQLAAQPDLAFSDYIARQLVERADALVKRH